MDASAITKRLVGAMALVVVWSLWATAAHGASISGSGTDSRDAASGEPDLERLTIGYDDSAGVIIATYTFYPGVWRPASLYLRFGLSKPGQGGCLANPEEPDLDFHAQGDVEIGILGEARLNARTGSTARIPAGYAGGPVYSWTLPGSDPWDPQPHALRLSSSALATGA